MDEKDAKNFVKAEDVESIYRPESSEEEADGVVIQDDLQLVTQVISVDDDPSLNPWTFRVLVIGIGLSAFEGVLAEIYYFKPQTVLVSTMFLAIIGYVLGIFMEYAIPQWLYVPGIGSCSLYYLDPGPFNKKELAFILIMSSAAATSALGTETLAVQRLFYNITPNPAASIFLLFSSQLIGYGIAGIMRPILLYPTKMLYPGVLPLISMFDAFYRDVAHSGKKLKVFYIVFFAIFFWELLPEYLFPLLTGFSIFCLANQRSADFTRIFGGSNGNEGLGILSFCFDWQYISGGTNPMAIPLKAQFSNFIGYILCILVFVGVFYGNVWNSRTLPFLAQDLFYENGTIYNQTNMILVDFVIDKDLLAKEGLPFYAGSWVVQLLTSNLGLAATFTHLLLWNYNDLRSAWSWATPSGLRAIWARFNWRFWQASGDRSEELARAERDGDMDPHYREMLKYSDAPDSWYYAILLVSCITALVLIYKTDSTLPWWGFVISLLLAVVSILFFGALYAITGLAFIIQPFVQMVGGFIHPGKPMANMYFVLFSYNSVIQASLLLRDLKIAQYVKLPPRAAFAAQISGTLLGAVLNFVMMNSIIDNQRPILLSVEGTNIWSGQQPQQYNSQAIAWGGLSKELFATGSRYDWVAWAYVVGLAVPIPFWLVHRYWPQLRLDYLYTPVICYYIGWLCVGINSSITSYFIVAYVSQYWLRRKHPSWFAKYNYIIGAALDGGTQVMVFILSFAVQGAAGDAHLIPTWWGANNEGNYDRCFWF
ncbi:OPT superfamily oligopeptide transporter [Auricularia subglabra TFB-10046 SS5]|uniref:OPT superfamily oligopeptide transporter n=1 Tax=Auricularia subglabra (strain TFB-10046 / SS5) TaxID=717982 RepID=J0D0W2_AURST|nr:OPT superfamily oligopeptide transporter [Auricularia subglabra TFB-10046 SS5]